MLLVCTTVVIVLAVVGSLVPGQAKFWIGMFAGATMTAYIALRDSPPFHIEKWRLGQEGERRTAKALGRLRDPGWRVWHDLAGRNGTNVDHVVVGPAGVFLLDSKNYSGEASIRGGELALSWLEDPKNGWTCQGMVPRMRGAAAELKEQIEAATGVRVWVQAVVVLWSRFPEGAGEVSDVHFVHGDSLVEWLLGRKPRSRPRDAERVSDYLDHAPAAGAAARSRG